MKSSNGKTTTRSTTTARPESPANNPQKDLLWPPIQSENGRGNTDGMYIGNRRCQRNRHVANK
jgi:hypothetical protein